MPFIKLTKIERKRFLIFIICLIFAVGAWLFMALSNKYVYNAETEIIYKNEPTNKAFKALQPDTVSLQVEGTGWQLIFSKLRINPQSITVSLERLNKRNFIVFSEQLPQINKQLKTSQKIISIKPDTLFFDFSKRTNKRVPLKLVSNLNFIKQYDISNDIKLTPAYVNISGPQEELAKIKIWCTDTLLLKNIRNSVSTRVNILHNTSNHINIYPKNIGVKIPVDEFTEKTLEIPLTVINNTDFYDIKLYPKKVKITFMVSLSSYNVIDEDFFEAIVDLKEWKELKHEKLNVKITRFPKYCKIVNIYPSKVNFIIEK